MHCFFFQRESFRHYKWVSTPVLTVELHLPLQLLRAYRSVKLLQSSVQNVFSIIPSNFSYIHISNESCYCCRNRSLLPLWKFWLNTSWNLRFSVSWIRRYLWRWSIPLIFLSKVQSRLYLGVAVHGTLKDNNIQKLLPRLSFLIKVILQVVFAYFTYFMCADTLIEFFGPLHMQKAQHLMGLPSFLQTIFPLILEYVFLFV